MLVKYELRFSSGCLITEDLLRKMVDPSRELLELLCSDNTDGTVSGMNLYLDEEHSLWIGPGVFRYHGELYYLREAREVCSREETASGFSYSASLAPTEATSEDGSITEHALRIIFRKTTQDSGSNEQNEILLFRFKGTPRLPSRIREISETLFDLRPWPYSVRDSEPGYHPLLFLPIREELEKKADKSPLEMSMLVLLLQNGTLPCSVMRAYLREANRLQDDMDRNALLVSFSGALLEAGKVKTVRIPESSEKQESILLRSAQRQF